MPEMVHEQECFWREADPFSNLRQTSKINEWLNG